MENKDWITLGGIFVTFLISSYSLFINIKNRKNAIREHLYKEQINFFLKLSNHFAILSTYFDDIFIIKNKYEEFEKLIDEQIDKIYILLDSHDFLIPDEILKIIYKTESDANELHAYIMRNKENLNKDTKKQYFKTYFNLLEELRKFIGVNKLSSENRKLIAERNTLPPPTVTPQAAE